MIIHCPHCKEELVAEITGRALVACPVCEFLFAIETAGRAQIPTFAEEQSLPRVAARRPAQVAAASGPDATHVGDTSDAFGTLPLPSGKTLYLEVVESAADPAPGTVFRFNKGRMILGRSDADILLDDEKISRKHALIEAISRENIYLKDLASTNGTFLNGHRVMMKKLCAGDEISVGRVRLKFHMNDA